MGHRKVVGVAVAAVLLIAIVGEVVASSSVSNQSYYGSFVVASGLLQPATLGFNSGMVFLSNSAGIPLADTLHPTQSIEILNPSTLALSSIATFSNPTDGLFSPTSASFDASGNAYYFVLSGNGTEAIFKQTPSGGGYLAPVRLFSDAQCGAFNPSSPCSYGFSSLVSDSAGNLYFAENLPSGSSTLNEIPSGTTTVTTLTTLTTSSGSITTLQVLFVPGELVFDYENSTSTTSYIRALSLPTGPITTLMTAPVGPALNGFPRLFYIALGPSISGPKASLLYYVYRSSRGPLNFGGGATGYPPARVVIGAISTTGPTSSKKGLPGQIANMTFPSPVSIGLGLDQPWINFVSVSGSGNIIFFDLPFTTGGLSSAAYDLVWFSPVNSQFSQLVSEDTGQTGGQGTFPSFTMDASGNIFYASTTGTIVEILAS